MNLEHKSFELKITRIFIFLIFLVSRNVLIIFLTQYQIWRKQIYCKYKNEEWIKSNELGILIFCILIRSKQLQVYIEIVIKILIWTVYQKHKTMLILMMYMVWAVPDDQSV